MSHRTTCAVCGAGGELHRHHLIPRVHGGKAGPTVMLCLDHHSQVHGRTFPADHRALTIAGLERARARGVKLGSVQARKGFDAELSQRGRAVQSMRAAAFFAGLAPHLAAAEAAGCRTQREIADFLQARGVPTPRGRGRWHQSQVQRALTARSE